MISWLDIKTMYELITKYKKPMTALALFIYRIFGDDAAEHFIKQHNL